MMRERTALVRRRAAGRLELADRRWLLAALLSGGILRVLVLAIGPLSGGDGTIRLVRAIDWARAPKWEGLSGIWPPLHWYIFGSLIRLWPNPLFWSFSLGLASELGTIYLLFRSVKHLYGDARVAGWSAFLLAIYWTHASLVGSNFVEVYYLFFIMLAIYCATAATTIRRAGSEWYSLGCGIAIALALLLRHEAKLVWPIFLFYLWCHAGVRSTFWFFIPSFMAFAWQLLEPLVTGQGYVQWTSEVNEMKALDQLLLNQSIVDALKRWILMPSATPSFVVVALGIAGIWMRRSLWKRELFLMIFVVQVSFYFAMTVVADWNPQQRYVMLYFINLLPYAAVAMSALQTHGRLAPVALILCIMLIQGAAWGSTRGGAPPIGWLPVQILSPSQVALEHWMREVGPGTRIYEIAPYALQSRGFRTVSVPWDAYLGVIRTNRTDLSANIRYATPRELMQLNEGKSLDLSTVDIVLTNPQAPLYEAIVRSLPLQHENEVRDDSLHVIRLHPGALTDPG